MNAPIYFYYPKEVPQILNYKSGLDCWILKTYLELNKCKRDFSFNLVSHIPDEGIIFFHKGFFPDDQLPSDSQLFICIQADYGRHRYAQCHIAQNPVGVNNFKFSKKSFFDEKLFSFTSNFFIPLWNQNSIIERNSSKREGLKNVSFFGVSQNFPEELKSVAFKEKLRREGIELNLITDSNLWNDYSQVDCVLAIRDFQSNPHYNKPFSKIINGFLAGVPVIAGNESSSLYLNEIFGDCFPIVKNQEECFDAIKSVQNNYSDYLQNVKQSNEKLKEFHDDSIILAWERYLSRAQKKYFLWVKSSSLAKKIYYNYRK